MERRIYGYCSRRNKETSILVDYLCADSLEGEEYVKGRYKCDCNFGNCKICSIWKNAPNVIIRT